MTLLLLLRGGASASSTVVVPDAGGADGPAPRRKKKRRIIEAPPPPKSVEEQVEEFLRSKKAKPLSKKATAKEIIKELTTSEKEAMRYWAEQQDVDAEDEEIVMLLMAL